MLPRNSHSSPSCEEVAGVAIIVSLDDLNDVELVVVACELGLIESCTVDLSIELQNVVVCILQSTEFIDWNFTFELDCLDHLFLLFLLVILQSRFGAHFLSLLCIF